MIKRTTIELDQDLLARAKRALGCKTARETVEQALRQAADAAEADFAERRKRQMEFLRTLGDHVDLEILKSDEMWR